MQIACLAPRSIRTIFVNDSLLRIEAEAVAGIVDLRAVGEGGDHVHLGAEARGAASIQSLLEVKRTCRDARRRIDQTKMTRLRQSSRQHLQAPGIEPGNKNR